ncbi:hypothetical protein QPK87_13535 [Kamptonema cortianum]|nr:hypothetical protein [Geitlerinema splendidum]MDK3157589.1 hypothetical protein [Kamptonema cortianum]
MTIGKKIAVVALGMTMAAGAFANNGDGYWKLGFGRMQSSAEGDATSENGFVLGYGRKLNMQTGDPSVMTGWEIFWARNGSGDRVDTLAVLFRGSKAIGEGKTYAGLGAGFAYHDIKVGIFDEAATKFAFTAFLGHNFSPESFLELGFLWSGSVEGFDTDRMTLTVGVRF